MALKKELHPLARDFYEYLIYDKSPGTAYNYARNVDSFLKFVKKPIGDITPLDITRWYRHLEEGFMRVPEKPGLGLELDEREVVKHLKEGEAYFP